MLTKNLLLLTMGLTLGLNNNIKAMSIESLDDETSDSDLSPLPLEMMLEQIEHENNLRKPLYRAVSYGDPLSEIQPIVEMGATIDVVILHLAIEKLASPEVMNFLYMHYFQSVKSKQPKNY